MKWPPVAFLIGLALVATATTAVLVGRSHSDRPTGTVPLRPDVVVRLATPDRPPTPRQPGTTPVPASAPNTRTTSRPVRLTVPALHIDARVVPVGVDRNEDIAIPPDVHTLGWYRYGAAPGDPNGSIVVVGHVDSATQGLGTFFELHTVPARATVVVRTSDGREWRYQVVGRRQYLKTRVPLGAIFAQTGAPRLTLITCGGSFDRATRSYLANVVVTALPRAG